MISYTKWLDEGKPSYTIFYIEMREVMVEGSDEEQIKVVAKDICNVLSELDDFIINKHDVVAVKPEEIFAIWYEHSEPTYYDYRRMFFTEPYGGDTTLIQIIGRQYYGPKEY